MEELKSERVADQQEIMELLTSIVCGEQKKETLEESAKVRIQSMI